MTAPRAEKALISFRRFVPAFILDEFIIAAQVYRKRRTAVRTNGQKLGRNSHVLLPIRHFADNRFIVVGFLAAGRTALKQAVITLCIKQTLFVKARTLKLVIDIGCQDKIRELPACPVETTLTLIGDKWKVLILRDLMPGTKRFGELKNSIGSVSQKVLTAQLRYMERNGLVHREVYAEVPPRVEYSLTELGKSLKPILDSMRIWGESYKKQLGS